MPYLYLNPYRNPQYESVFSLQSEPVIALRWPRPGIPPKLRMKVVEIP
jgi:hypothetical protein